MPELTQTDDWQDEPAAERQREVDWWGILVRRKWIIILCVLLGMIAGTLYYLRAEPVYESVSQVMIEPRQNNALSIGNIDPVSRMAFSNDVAKHPVVLTSPQVIGRAVDDGKLTKFKCLQSDDGNPIGTIIENMAVAPVDEGIGIYNISFRGTDSEEVGEVVNSVVEAYRDFLEEMHATTDLETRTMIVQAEQELRKELERKETAYAKFRQTAPLLLQGEEGTNIHAKRLATIEDKRANATLELIEIETELGAFEGSEVTQDDAFAVLATANNSFLSSIVNARDNEKAVDRNILLPLLIEEQELVSKYGADHPKVKSVRRRIEFSKKFYRDVVGQELDEPDEEMSFVEELESKKELYVQAMEAYLTSRQRQAVQLNQQIERLSEEFDEEETAARALDQYTVQDEALRNDIENTRQLFDVVVRRLDETEAVGNQEGYHYQILAAAAPGLKVAPSLPKTTALAILLSGMIGYGLAYLIELADKSFHSPSEISQQLRVPVLAHIPHFDMDHEIEPDLAQFAPSLITMHDSDSLVAEAYRSVRTGLLFNARDKKHQVVQITSPRPSDGKSTLAANLAVNLANSGKSVLLLESDLRRPTVHRMFGLDRSPGFADCLEDVQALRNAYRQIPTVPNLTVLTAGTRVKRPSELVSSAAYRDALEHLRSQFEFVVVDTPPLLAVSDSVAIAAQMDGVLLTMRLHSQARPAAQRCVAVLRETGADLIGLVVNDVGAQEITSYHGYGSRYGYEAKNYGYIYGKEYKQRIEEEETV